MANFASQTTIVECEEKAGDQTQTEHVTEPNAVRENAIEMCE